MSSSRKIAFIVQDLCGQGAQHATATVIRGFVARGYAVDLLITRVHDDKVAAGHVPFTLPPSVNVIYLPSRRARGNVYALRRYIARTDAEAVVSTSGPYHLCHRLALLGLRGKLPLSVHMDHGNTGCAEGRVFDCISKWRLAYWRTRFVWGGFDRHFFVNETSRLNALRFFPNLKPDSTFTVFNPAVDDELLAKAKYTPTHPWLMKKECCTIVSAGAYCESKGFEDLIRAVELANEKAPVRLILFGRGPLKDRYLQYVREHRLEERVSVSDYATNLMAEMRASDGFALASHWESFGLVLVEALAAGVPVISTDAPFGPRDVLADGRYGKLVPVGDVKQMADAIVALARGDVPVAPHESWERFTIGPILDRFERGLQR